VKGPVNDGDGSGTDEAVVGGVGAFFSHAAKRSKRKKAVRERVMSILLATFGASLWTAQ
jgi:hypothetical protein